MFNLTWGAGLLWALAFAVPAGLLALIRAEDNVLACALNMIIDVILLFIIDGLVLWQGRPLMTFAGLLPLIITNLVVILLVSAVVDTSLGLSGSNFGLSGATVAAFASVLVFGTIFIVGHNSGGSAYAASHIVRVTVEPKDALPATSTAQMMVVSPGIAQQLASQDMATPTASGVNYSTYDSLGDSVLEPAFGQMQYVFPLVVDGAGNKQRQHATVPGYETVSATDPSATAVHHFGGQDTMIIDQGMGQGAEPDRYVRTHGYASYLTDTPQFQVDPSGRPFWVVPLLRPHDGWTFFAPVGIALVNAHTGSIAHYNLGNMPSWVNRVYSEGMAVNIADWYGNYAHASFSTVGSTNANRYQVSYDPSSGSPYVVQVWTGAGYPVYRMLLTSYNTDVGASKIIEMNPRTGALHVYTPRSAMGIESTVLNAFGRASGQGASLMHASGWVPVDPTLHVIFGHLTWMATYESGGSSPSFAGLGFVDAYHVRSDNVAFGTTKSAALQNYLTQLATQPSANGSAPGQGGNTTSVSGTVSTVTWDVTAGQKNWYLQLKGDTTHAYEGTVSATSPALAFVAPGDHVTMTFLKVNAIESVRTMQSFTDTQVPLKPAGS